MYLAIPVYHALFMVAGARGRNIAFVMLNAVLVCKREPEVAIIRCQIMEVYLVQATMSSTLNATQAFPVPLMEDGRHGMNGICALSHADLEFKNDNGNVTIRFLTKKDCLAKVNLSALGTVTLECY